jgi:hypothetical protein
MSKAAVAAAPASPPKPSRRIVKKFAAPDSLPEECGAYTIREGEMDGFVTTENIPVLFDAFGITERRATEFPFQVISKRDGDIHRMRVEAEAMNDVDGVVARTHRWTYEQKAKDQY